MDLSSLPGGDLVARGRADLAAGRESVESLLVEIGAPRLRRLGLELPEPTGRPEHRLYELLAQDGLDGSHGSNRSDTAHGRYNALVRRLVSFERAAELVARRSSEPACADPSTARVSND